MSTTGPSLTGVSPLLSFMNPDMNSTMASNLTNDLDPNSTGDGMTTAEKIARLESYTLYKVTTAMADYNLWVIMAFGIPGNIACIFTIMSMSTVSSSKAHVATLAVVDTMSIILKIAYQEISAHHVQITVPGCILLMFFQQVSPVYANWVLVAMTAERFLAVWFPLRVGRMYTRRKALIVLGCLALSTCAVYLFFFWAFTEYYEAGYGYWCSIKPTYREFVNGSFYWIDAFYYAIMPCSVILIGNALIMINIKRARKAQRHLTNAFDQGGRKARDQRQITIMLIVVSVAFLLLNIPNALFYMIKPYWKYERYSYEHAEYMFTFRFIHMLSDANHAVNFYLYFLSMSTFRRRLIYAVRCRSRTARRPASTSDYRTSQTYMHSVHQATEDSRPDINSVYSAYKRSNNKMDSTHSLKSYSSSGNNNRLNSGLSNPDNHSAVTAASDL